MNYKVLSDPAGLTIGYDREQDIANGFRVSEKGITLITIDMLDALANKQANCKDEK